MKNKCRINFRLPTKALQDKTPYEAWYDHKPTVHHLRIFGCICYYQVPESKRSKLDNRAQKGIFMGYGSSCKGYRIFCLKTEKIILSRDVKFYEAAAWYWENKKDAHVDLYPKQQPKFATDDLVDDLPVRATKSLEDIYQRCSLVVNEPTSYAEAQESRAWRSAMQAELDMINKNETWQLVDRPTNRKVIGVRWVFKTKLNPDGSICKHKAKLVVKGYAQQYGVDYQETFSPVARYDTIKLLLAFATHNSWQIHQLDVKSAFLNGLLTEEIFVEQPDGFLIHGKENQVYLLKKALYGLKQAPRAWYERMDSHLMQLGFSRSQSEATLYARNKDDEVLVVSIYVDDMLVTGSKLELIQKFKNEMEKVFEMTDLGVMKYFLGMEVMQTNDGLFICQ